MHTLLFIEWLKIKRYRTFWILIGLFALLLPLWNYEIAQGFIKMGGGINFLSTAYSFPQVWGNLGFWGSIFIMFLSILVIILTTNEYGYRTHRQNVIDGWQKIEFYHAKIMMVFVLSLAATLYLFVLGAIFGGANGSLSNIFSEFQQVGYFFLLSFDYLAFSLLLALLIKRSGLAIGLFLLYSMIIENILKGVINHYADKPYGNLLPLQASDELLPFPLMQMAKTMMHVMPTLSNTTYCITTIAWCAVYYMAGLALVQKRDW